MEIDACLSMRRIRGSSHREITQKNELRLFHFSSPRAVPPKYIHISCTLAVCYNSSQSVSMSNNSNNLLQDLIGKDSSA